MKNPYLTIVIPVYQSNCTLQQVIESVLNQVFDDWELILVDDGSTDESGKICDRYSLQDSRIRTLHQLNAGPGSARNRGIEFAKGEYITFLDADDWVEPEMYKEMCQCALKTDADIVMCGFWREFWDSGIMKHVDSICLPEKHFLDESLFKAEFNQLFQSTYTHVLWNKLYRLAPIKSNSLFLPIDINLGEDLIFNLQCFRFLKRIYIIDHKYYHYRQINSNSLTQQFNFKFWPNQERLFCETENFLQDIFYIELEAGAHNDLLLRSFFIMLECALTDKSLSKRQIKEIYEKAYLSECLQKAIKRKGTGNSEFLVYRVVLKLNCYTLICLFARVRLFVKQLIRASG